MHFIIKLILHWLILTASVILTTYIVPGFAVYPMTVAFIVGACLTVFYMFVKPIITILTLPLNLVTMGLFPLVVNTAIFWFLGTLISGFTVTTFYAAFLGSLVVSVINWILSKVFHL